MAIRLRGGGKVRLWLLHACVEFIPVWPKELKQQQEGVIIPAGLTLLVIFVTAIEVDHGAPIADRRGSLWSTYISMCGGATRVTLSKMPVLNGKRDTFLVDIFAVLAARYCMQTVSTHH